jgi:hypothetical protein
MLSNSADPDFRVKLHVRQHHHLVSEVRNQALAGRVMGMSTVTIPCDDQA